MFISFGYIYKHLSIKEIKEGKASMNFSKTLITLRKQKQLTQKQLASHLNISRSTLAGYETKSRQPDFETLQNMASFFGVSIDYLVSGNTIPHTGQNTFIDEVTLDHEINIAFQQLNFSAKQNLLKYIHLLLLQELN